MNNNGELEPRQKRFCEEYLVDLNATQAAIRAGYSKRSAYSTSYENLQIYEIQRYISELTLWRSLRTQVTADRVLEELAKIAFAKEGVKIKDKLKALDILAKHVCINEELLDLEKEARRERAYRRERPERKRLKEEDLVRVLAELEKRDKERSGRMERPMKRDATSPGSKAGDNGEDQ